MTPFWEKKCEKKHFRFFFAISIRKSNIHQANKKKLKYFFKIKKKGQQNMFGLIRI